MNLLKICLHWIFDAFYSSFVSHIKRIASERLQHIYLTVACSSLQYASLFFSKDRLWEDSTTDLKYVLQIIASVSIIIIIND